MSDDIDRTIQELSDPLYDDRDDHTTEEELTQHASSIQHKAPPKQVSSSSSDASGEEGKDSRSLMIAFTLMVVIGLGNKIMNVLQFIPMYNYPLFLNLLSTFIYLPVSFAYIWPMLKYGTAITPEAEAVPKFKFAVMGLLDSLAGIMQTLATNFLANGSLVILLQQAAIPISMMISYYLMKKRYMNSQYVGAVIVTIGLVVVLLPSFIHPTSSGSNIPLWAGIMVASCIPMCLSSVYKEIALGDADIDAIYMNGWIAVYQMLASIPLLIPSAPLSNLTVGELPENLWNGAKCFVRINTVMHGKHKDDCSMSPIYVSFYLAFNIGYNILILLILKFGSANILWLAMTIMVPLGNVAFALDFMPNHRALKFTDILGLVLIISGLIIYRFYEAFSKRWKNRNMNKAAVSGDSAEVPSSPFLTSKSADDNMSTPGRGGVHTIHKKKKDRASRQRKEDRGKAPSSRATKGYQQVRDDTQYDEDDDHA